MQNSCSSLLCISGAYTQKTVEAALYCTQQAVLMAVQYHDAYEPRPGLFKTYISLKVQWVKAWLVALHCLALTVDEELHVIPAHKGDMAETPTTWLVAPENIGSTHRPTGVLYKGGRGNA